MRFASLGRRVALDKAQIFQLGHLSADRRMITPCTVREFDNILQRFMREVLPNATNDERTLAGDLIRTTFGTVGKTFSETPRSDVAIAAYADAMADMFEAYLLRLSGNI